MSSRFANGRNDMAPATVAEGSHRVVVVKRRRFGIQAKRHPVQKAHARDTMILCLQYKYVMYFDVFLHR